MLTSRIFYVIVGLIWLSMFADVFPITILKSKEWSDNPNKCAYYITIQSIMANSKLLASDKANLHLIKNRLIKFEKDIKQIKSKPSLVDDYKVQYYNALKLINLDSVSTVTNDSLILLAANKTSKIVDNFYLDDNLHCLPPLYTWNTAHTVKRNPHMNARRILQYNLASLYEKIPNRYMRITGACQDEFQLGVFSGFFVNNQTTSLNIQLMTGEPMLTALYVIPKNDFSNMGTYLANVPWNSIYGMYFKNADYRKIMNIAGIDVFTVETSDPDWQTIPGAIPVPATINKAFVIAKELHTYVNSESYGMAYLANHITYENPIDIKKFEKVIKRYFSSGGLNKERFIYVSSLLFGKLNDLKVKYDIILESNAGKNSPSPDIPDLAGSVVIKGIVGERANFNVDCLRQDCTFVFNAAKAPGWHAYVNGKAARIERANFAFMAVVVPKGQAVVWFIYQSWACLFSYLLSILCLIFIFFHTVHDINLEAPQLNQLSDATADPAGSVLINGIVGERARFTTDCLRHDCSFVFNIAKAPGWHVFVNGKSLKVERANFAFMATTVPNGHSILWFIYHSWASFISYLLSIFCLVGIFFRRNNMESN